RDSSACVVLLPLFFRLVFVRPRLFLSFFPRSAAPRHLLSFPTRRSSDLQRHRARAAARGDAGEQRDVDRPDGTVGQGHADEQHRDRKSTRLNSSHVSISYAVFCLKKKKEDATPEGSERTHVPGRAPSRPA